MANDQNQCNFTGRLGQAVDLRYTSGGTAVANVTIAVGRKKKLNGEWKDVTEWVPLVLFDKKAEALAKHSGKGLRIGVTGEFQTRKWQDQSGNDRYKSEILVNDLRLIDFKENAQKQAPQGQEPSSDDFDDDIPF